MGGQHRLLDRILGLGGVAADQEGGAEGEVCMPLDQLTESLEISLPRLFDEALLIQRVGPPELNAMTPLHRCRPRGSCVQGHEIRPLLWRRPPAGFAAARPCATGATRGGCAPGPGGASPRESRRSPAPPVPAFPPRRGRRTPGRRGRRDDTDCRRAARRRRAHPPPWSCRTPR